MRGSKRNKRVIIQSSAETRDSYGAAIETWNTYKSVWANISPDSNNEKLLSDTIDTSSRLKITINYFDGLTHKMRILYNDRVFNIKSIINREERNRDLVLTVVENVN